MEGNNRTAWHTLELGGFRVPRIVVQEIIRELDPEGTGLRKSHRLKRREYRNPGHNYAWHVDGYYKLKPWGFPIHGCIDGFTRCIMWLEVAHSNNLPEYAAMYYVEADKDLGGCPVEVVTDFGTENGLLASIQTYFRQNPAAHRYALHHIINELRHGSQSIPRTDHHGGEIFKIWKWMEKLT